MIGSFYGKNRDANTVAKNIENEEFHVGFGKAFENVLVVVVGHVLQNCEGYAFCKQVAAAHR